MQSLEVTTKPLSFYNRCIKIVYVSCCNIADSPKWSGSTETAVKLLPYCQGAEYVFWWISLDCDARLKNLLINMRPKRLDADFINPLSTPQPDFSLPFFDNVTHLVIVRAPKNWTAIRALPRLSHFLIDWIKGYPMLDSCDLLKVAVDVLSHCRTLKVCAIRYADGCGPNLDATLRELQDGRLVFIIAVDDWLSDWLSFARGEPDTWVYAEAAVAKQTRQGGRVEPIRC
jgi:hypothetical protein